MINLLLLSAGTGACYHVARVLKEKFVGDFRIIGADINERHLIPTCEYLDVFYRVPYSNTPGYYEKILEICKQEHVNFLIPSFDADQKMFYPENEDLKKLGVVSFGTSQKTLPVYDNKVKMSDFLRKNGFPVPNEYNKSQIKSDVEYMVKPINGVGSVGASLKYGRDIDKINTDNYVIQEKCFEPEITMECFNYGDFFSCVCRERIAAKSGVCVKGRIFNDEKLANIGRQFVKKLDAPHIFNLQFMTNSDGEYVITDVNLRTAGGMSMAHAAGWDEVSALAKIMQGKSVNDIVKTLPDKIPETFVMRAYTDIVTQKTK